VTIREAADAIRDKRISPQEMVTAAIARYDRMEPSLKAFISLRPEYAMLRAEQAERELRVGRDRGPLHGIPIAVKDLFAMRGVRTTSGSKVFEHLEPDFNSSVVDKLEAAGAVIMGKLNMHELAYGITSANPYYGAVRNPWDIERSPGGSSGGSGAAVTAGIIYGAMGSDTGGSIRIPASFCGCVGIKPTYGRVSRFGALPLAYSLDHMGPMARSVREAAMMLNAIAGPDKKDDTTARRPVPDFVPEENCSIKGLRIGLPENFFMDRVQPEVETAVRAALSKAEAIGAEIKPVWLPDMNGINAIARIILLAEASAMLEPYLEHRGRFGADVLTLLDQGRLVPATDYINAQRLRRKLRTTFNRVWSEVDCLITPTTPTTAPRVGETVIRINGREEDVRLATTRLVRGFNALGLPALSMPCGLANAMPVGLQIIGPEFEEAQILKIGAALEDAGVKIPPCPMR
jgi:aspartyl-tRNA(Asn)/glutamyl-tRNA(Gln) amidotransferase subunit A